MRFEEPDVRAANRRGARDRFESLESSLNGRQVHEIEEELQALED